MPSMPQKCMEPMLPQQLRSDFSWLLLVLIQGGIPIRHCKILLLLKEGQLQLRILHFSANFHALRLEGLRYCKAFLHPLAGIQAAC